MIHVPDYRLEPEEPKIFCYCSECEVPIYYGDTYYKFDYENICPDCIENHRGWAVNETV